MAVMFAMGFGFGFVACFVVIIVAYSVKIDVGVVGEQKYQSRYPVPPKDGSGTRPRQKIILPDDGLRLAITEEYTQP